METATEVAASGRRGCLYLPGTLRRRVTNFLLTSVVFCCNISNAVAKTCRSGGTGRRAVFRAQWALRPCGFESHLRHHFFILCRGGGTGRRARLRGVWVFPCGFESRPRHHKSVLCEGLDQCIQTFLCCSCCKREFFVSGRGSEPEGLMPKNCKNSWDLAYFRRAGFSGNRDKYLGCVFRI